MVSTHPWEHWFHCMSGTYGSWLRGDPRGWRERHHRVHVEGDYRNPPKLDSCAMFHKSKELMKRDAVRLDARLRWIALVAIVESLRQNNVYILVASLDDHHLYLLGKFPEHNPRILLGWAKFHATKAVKRYLKAHGSAVRFKLQLREGEGIWAKRSKAEPIRDRSHQVNTCGYIAKHGTRGAAIFMHPMVERVLIRDGKIRLKRKSPPRGGGLS